MDKRRKIAVTIAKTTLCSSILISCFFSTHSTVVILSSCSALASLVTLKLLGTFRRHHLTMLTIAESNERSFLIEMKKRVKSGKPFNDELINLCDTATGEAEAKYKIIHGFSRPFEKSSRKVTN